MADRPGERLQLPLVGIDRAVVRRRPFQRLLREDPDAAGLPVEREVGPDADRAVLAEYLDAFGVVRVHVGADLEGRRRPAGPQAAAPVQVAAAAGQLGPDLGDVAQQEPDRVEDVRAVGPQQVGLTVGLELGFADRTDSSTTRDGNSAASVLARRTGAAGTRRSRSRSAQLGPAPARAYCIPGSCRRIAPTCTLRSTLDGQSAQLGGFGAGRSPRASRPARAGRPQRAAARGPGGTGRAPRSARRPVRPEQFLRRRCSPAPRSGGHGAGQRPGLDR